MKSVLISIQPKWCERIANGSKTIEVRKTAPKIATPFKVYIYATKSGDRLVLKSDKVFEISRAITGKVIGEFICDEITDARDMGGDEFYQKSCLTYEDWRKYTDGTKNTIWLWYISDLVIYDKPRELSEFKRFCDGISGKIGCRGCKYYYEENDESQGHFEMCGCDNMRPITRPPQSWCYVESEG